MIARLRFLAVASVACACVALGGPMQNEVPPDAAPKKVEPPTKVIPREGCVTTECHPGVKKHQYMHGPLNANMCDSCHTLKDATKHTFEQSRSREQMCTLCHDVQVPAGESMHKPFAEGECLSCHDPHGSNEKSMLRGAQYADACKTCHQDVTGAHDWVHGPASAGACGACHEPHAARLPKLLIAEGRDLCLRCHISVGLAIESKRVVHQPALGDCQVCHNPHATDNAAMLVTDRVSLCTGCHEDIGRKIETASTQHEAVTTKRECLNCHSPHASDNARLLKTDVKSLCFECHNQVITLNDGRKIPNMKDIIEKGKSLHGAIAEGSCVQCHEIHGGGHRRLLKSEYPSDLYYPFAESLYSLCFSCHDRQLVLQSRTDTVTAFRNGDHNLHYEHVNRPDKGRSCAVCHDAHAADHERHIRDEIPFGPKGWMLPIKYERLPEGGRCGPGCHAAFEYSRTNPIVYPANQPNGAWKGADLVPGVRAEPPKPPADPRKK